MIIGICGKSGSGKSTLANEIIEVYANAVHLDIDKIGHKVLTMTSVEKELVTTFGTSILSEERVDRKKLGKLVFSSSEEMEKLSEITWKYMQMEIDVFLKNNRNRIIILDWLLFPKTKYFAMCDKTILLDIPYEVRKKRAMKRDSISEDAFLLRDNAGINYSREDFDYVLQNNEKESIRKLVKKL